MESEVGSSLLGQQRPRRLAASSEAGSSLGGHKMPRRSAAVMFQCFCGLYIDVFNKCSQEEKEEKEDKIDL